MSCIFASMFDAYAGWPRPDSSSPGVARSIASASSIVHELVVFRTDLDEADLPLTADGDRVDESAAGLTKLEPEAEDVAPGDTARITLDLSQGTRFVVICNLPLHYTQGMHVVFNALGDA